jgi:hypothetical protein
LSDDIRQLLRNQTEQDSAIQELAISMKDVLAFATEACTLEKLNGGIDVIKEMAIAIQDCANLINDYIKSPFFREFLRTSILYFEFEPD